MIVITTGMTVIVITLFRFIKMRFINYNIGVEVKTVIGLPGHFGY